MFLSFNNKVGKMKTTFPATCWIAAKYMVKNWIFFLIYLFLNAALLSIYCLGIYFYLSFGLLAILGTWIATILSICFGFFFVYFYTWLHVFAMNDLKQNFENPSEKVSFTHLNQKKYYLVGPTLQMMISWGFSAVMFLCLVIPYFFAVSYYFFTPVMIAFFPNIDQVTLRDHTKILAVQSKNVRLYLAFFPLLFFFAPMSILGYLVYIGFYNWFFITLGFIVFLMYPIYRYTVGTIYFYFHWETDGK